MIIESQSCDPRVHQAAMDMAREIVRVFSGILMNSEKHAALTEAYRVAREGLEAFNDNGRKA